MVSIDGSRCTLNETSILTDQRKTNWLHQTIENNNNVGFIGA